MKGFVHISMFVGKTLQANTGPLFKGRDEIEPELNQKLTFFVLYVSVYQLK